MYSETGCFCGEARRSPNNRITSGTETEVHEYPWMVFVSAQRRKPSGRRSSGICGGSLISDSWVITAAHCVVEVNKYGVLQSVKLELGQHNRNTGAIQVFIPLSQIFKHPDYNNPHSLSNDLALLKLDNPVDFNNIPHVRPICLPSNREETFTGLRATVAGWGIIHPSGPSSSVLLETNVNVISLTECRELYRQHGYTLSDDMLCTLSPSDGSVFQGSCSGDSGH